MRTLIRFLLRFKTLFIFLLLEILSLVMIVNHNQFQRVHFFSSSSIVVGTLCKWTNSVSQYFSLGKVNDALATENAELKKQLNQLKNQVEFFKSDTSYSGRVNHAEANRYQFITARVINATTNQKNNYLTIDKGEVDGIEEDMGVINESGVVGIVKTVSSHFSVVMPILNSETYINAKVKGKCEVGTLVWQELDTRHAKLEEVPLYIPIQQGDTVLSSAYSSIFPEGIMIGTVYETKSLKDNFHSIKVRLSVDFNNLSYVDVIQLKNAKELKDNNARKEDQE